jgi:hypothetical protein
MLKIDSRILIHTLDDSLRLESRGFQSGQCDVGRGGIRRQTFRNSTSFFLSDPQCALTYDHATGFRIPIRREKSREGSDEIHAARLFLGLSGKCVHFGCRFDQSH